MTTNKHYKAMTFGGKIQEATTIKTLERLKLEIRDAWDKHEIYMADYDSLVSYADHRITVLKHSQKLEEIHV